MAIAMAAMLCACTPAPSAVDTPRAPSVAKAVVARKPASIVISGDESEAQVEIWQPPLTELDAAALPEARRAAAAALREGRLYVGADDAIPLYLSILEQAPQDRQAKAGLAAAQQRLLQEGIVALRHGDDAERLDQAWEIAEVARTLASQDKRVMAFQRRTEQALRVRDFNLAGEEDLRAGRLGDSGDGAIQQFRAALALAPGQARAEQGLAAVESEMIRQAELAAQAVDYHRAEDWLQRAQGVRSRDVGTLDDAHARIEAMRRAHIAALHDKGMNALSAGSSGLKAARTALEEILRIADPGDPVAANLRERIDLATHYGAFRPGQVFNDAMQDGGRGPQMIVVPHGAFQMGAGDNEPGAGDAERPSHYVRFERGFAMQLKEVTVAEFGRYVAATNARPRATRRGHSIVYDERSGNFVRRSGVDWRSSYDGSPALPGDPVLHVSVRDAEAYATWLSQQTGRNYRLPSEAEFEYTLRAGNPGRYPWGNAGTPPKAWGNVAGGNDVSPSGRRWHNAFVGYGDGYWGPAPAGVFTSNPWGLYDLSGNVNEWVADCWHASYRRAPRDGVPWFNPGCRARVVRGGSWAGAPEQIRSAWRSSQDSDMTNARVGFRLVRGI